LWCSTSSCGGRIVRRALPSLPTRRSSDLRGPDAAGFQPAGPAGFRPHFGERGDKGPAGNPAGNLVFAHPREEKEAPRAGGPALRSEEHTSELQSRFELVCRPLLEKKNVQQ